jgi:hypothetical protein
MRYTAANPTTYTLPDGEYPFIVTAAEEKIASTGSEMIALTLKIKDGPTVYDNLVNVESAWFKTDQCRAAVGFKIVPGVETDINPDDFVGRTGRCVLYTDLYDGKRRNKVAEYLIPRPTAQPTKSTPAAQPAPAKVTPNEFD